MRRVNQYDFYAMGWAVHPLTEVRQGSQLSSVWLSMVFTRGAMDRLLANAIIPLRVSRHICEELRRHIVGVIGEQNTPIPDLQRPFSVAEAYFIADAAKRFETVLGAELQIADTYFIDQKGAFSTPEMIERAEIVLPESVRRVLPPAAIVDLRQAGRSLVLDLPTAAGFHMLRAAESLIVQYYHTVVGREPRDNQRNWGHYIQALREARAPEIVVGTLNQIRDLHRNPIMHPEDVLDDDDALVLFGIVQSAIVAVAGDLATRREQMQLALPERTEAPVQAAE